MLMFCLSSADDPFLAYRNNSASLALFHGASSTTMEGLWANWPDAPGIIRFTVRNLTKWIHSDWWRFAPMDKNGIPKAKLYATGD